MTHIILQPTWVDPATLGPEIEIPEGNMREILDLAAENLRKRVADRKSVV